ncbi:MULTISPECIES: restriction endonuclease subunit S [unclassified Microcoleus]|uniref:restriction endonuclease subunit S n=1 Tax=unclassified Microcoleus TaxID=2642155 RepID=UPI002FD21F64
MMIIQDKDLPNGWEWVSVGDICNIETGTTPSRAKPEFFGEGLPWVTPGDFDGSTYISKGREALTELGIREGRGKVFPSKTVLLVCIGATIGKVAVAARKISANQQINSLICGLKIYPEFLYFYLVYNKANLVSVASSSTVPIINQERLRTIEIPLPPLAEQKRIASIAQKADRLRRTRRYALQLSDTYLRSVFLEMFGNPATNPKSWEAGTLDDVIISAKDGPHVSPNYSDSGIPFLSTRNVKKGELIWEDLKFISYEDAKQHWKKCKPERGDVLYTKGGTTGLAKAIDFDREIAVWVHIAVLKLRRERVIPSWLESMLNTDFCYKQSQELTFGIVNRDLGLQRMPKIKIYIPPLHLQENFAEIVQKFDRLRTQQREAERQAEHLFQTILHRAFRGELTSQNADDEPESVLLEEIRAQQAKAEAEAKTATQAMGDAADYVGTKAKQQDIEPIQLKFPGFE